VGTQWGELGTDWEQERSGRSGFIYGISTILNHCMFPVFPVFHPHTVYDATPPRTSSKRVVVRTQSMLPYPLAKNWEQHPMNDENLP
jgi:hypothetical protein